MISRRRFLQLSGLVAAAATASACAPAYRGLAGEPRVIEAWPSGDADVFAALSRLTFGPRADERARAAEIGLAAWIEEQLAPETIDDFGTNLQLRRFPTLTMKAHELHDWSDKLFDDQDRAMAPDELRQATLLRQVYSRRQLYEVMAEFWTDHFNISVDKGDCFYLKTVDDRDVIRPHALGRFHDLVWASAHSPAMLVYLDQHVSDRTHPNENYARELMELHTLGVDGGYTQQDVMELARCLTGWTVKESWWRGTFTFNPDRHDDGVKTVLGLTLEPAGQAEAERVIEQLAVHPSTARFVSRKLAWRLLGPDAPGELIENAGRAFLKSGGDLRAVLRVLLLDGLAGGGATLAAKFKRPVNFVASALRQLNAATDAGPALHDLLGRMGQPYFAWPTPDGYPDRTEAWQGNLLPRWQFALALAQGQIEGTTIDLPALLTAAAVDSPAPAADRLGALLLGAPLPTAARDGVLRALDGAGDDAPRILAAGLVASPAFQWR
jgi:uncharacterized protein (DUF1800 family)